MKMTIRRDDFSKWGLVEGFKPYRYGETGSVTVTLGVTPEGNFTTPYVLRGGMFVPLSDIDSEIGLEPYMKAKKPIYSLLSDGFIMTLKCYFNYNTGEFIKEKSSFDVYNIVKTESVNARESKIYTVRLCEIPENIRDLSESLMKKVVESGSDRVKFLRSRY